jgi:uncharacterized Fe-S cluster-containing MiaB family protein
MLGVWYNGEDHRLTVILKGFRCSWDKCIFCCFSKEAAVSYKDLVETDLEILRQAKEIAKKRKIKELVLFNGSSFFELPYQVVLFLSELTDNCNLAVETRPEFLKEKTVLKTLQYLNPNILTFRIGIESASQKIRAYLRKGIDDKQIGKIINLREKIRTKTSDRVRFVAYILFGVEGITEASVKRSVEFFRKHLDGVIAIRYKKYEVNMPRETKPSLNLLKYLEENCEEVDMTESEAWEITDRMK